MQKEAYRLGAFGFCGNEDVGQLSAWFVLSAMGFAQVCPCDGKFYVNTPLFQEIKVRLDERYHNCAVSDWLTVQCDKDPSAYPYIEKVYYNGVLLERDYITYEELTAGGTLLFVCKAD